MIYYPFAIWSTSLNTILGVLAETLEVFSCLFSFLSSTTILIALEDLTRDIATYSCPWLNTGESKYNPNVPRVCPCALLIVIPNASFRGNCLRLISKGSPNELGEIKSILGMSTLSPAFLPVIISASITLSKSSLHNNYAPLRRRMTGTLVC